MEEGLILPQNITDQNLSFIDQLKLEDKNLHIRKKHIPLSNFRTLYQEDRKVFDLVVKESILRGGIFVTSKPSNFFPENKIRNSNLILHVSPYLPNNAYQNIDYSIVKLNHIMGKFNINSNDFYSRLPLEGFLNFNLSELELDLLKQEFIRVGFNFIGNKQQSIEKKMYTSVIIDEVNKNVKDEILKTLSLYVESPFLADNIRIVDVFSSELLNKMSFFKVTKISELDFYEIKEFFENLSTSEKKEFLNNLKRYINNKMALASYGSNLVSSFDSTARKLLLRELFIENKWNVVRNLFFVRQKEYLGDLTLEDFIFIFKSNGVGVTKMIKILDIIYLCGNKLQLLLPDYSLSNQIEKVKESYFPFDWIPDKEFFDLLISSKKYHFTKEELIINVEKLERKNKRKKEYIKIINEKKNGENYTFNKDFLEKYDVSLHEIMTIFSFPIDVKNVEHSKKLKESLNKSAKDLYMETTDEKDLIYSLTTFYFNKVKAFIEFDRKIEEVLLKESEITVFKKRIIEGKTLEEVGLELNVSRERVRQIEKKIYSKLVRLIEYNGVSIFRYHLEKEMIFNKDYFKISDQTLKILIHLNQTLDFEYIVETGELQSGNVVEKIEQFSVFVNQKINIKNYIAIDEIQGWLDYSLTKNLGDYILRNKEIFLAKIELQPLGNGYVPNKITKANLAIVIVEQYLPNNTIDLQDRNHITIFSTYFSKIFKGVLESFSEITRSLMGYFDRNLDKIIKIRPNVYKVFHLENIPIKLIDEVAEYTKRTLKTEPTIHMKKISQEYMPIFKKQGVSEYEVYYYLRFFYSDIFDFSSKNAMRIYMKGSEELSTEEVVFEKLMDLGDNVLIEVLVNDLGVERYTVEQACSRSDRFFISHGRVQSTKDNRTKLSEKLRDQIELLGNKMLARDGYILVQSLFDELRFDFEFSHLMLDAAATDIKQFNHILKSIFKNLTGHTKFLYPKENYVETLDVLLDQMNDINQYHRSDFNQVGKKIGYAEITTNIYINRGIEEGILIPINDVYLVHRDSFILDESILEKVSDFLSERIKEKGYLSCYQLQGMRRKLPRLEKYSWSPELVYYVATQYLSYKRINIKGVTHTVDPLLISTNEKERTYSQIVVELLKYYRGNMHEENIAEYLSEQGLIRTKNKQLPQVLFEEEVLAKDQIGRVSLLKVT